MQTNKTVFRITRRAAVVIVLILAGCAARVPVSTPLPSEPVVVSRLLIDVDGLEGDYPGKGGGLLPAIVEGVQIAKDIQKAAEAARNPEGSPIKAAYDSLYAIIQAELSAGLGLQFLPLDTLMGEVPYIFGYPMGNGEKLAASGRFPGVVEIEVYVTVPDQETGSYSILGTGEMRVSGHPEMEMKLRLWDGSGTVVWKDGVRKRSSRKVTLDEKWLLGFRRDRKISDNGTLPELTRIAVAEMVQKARTE